MTDLEAKEIAEPTWIYEGLFVEGHVIALPAKPNGGKTTICFSIACELAQKGWSVVFVHADTNPGDAKLMRDQARRHGVRYLTPDMKVGKTMADVVERLKVLANSDADLRGQVWFFDTLKKMANVINKDSLKNTLLLMRKLSSRGMTCMLLCHTNKYRNADGEWVFEGTGDLEADCDELIYLEPRENADGSLTVSTRCVKRRADIDSITWDIRPDRSVVRRSDYIDTAAEAAEQTQREKDQTVIEAITECLQNGPKKQTEVVAYCAALKVGEKRVRSALMRYTGRLWSRQKLLERNAWQYELMR